MNRLAALALLAAATSATHAAPVTYVIDNNHTYPRFSYDHFGYSTQLSRFDKTSGKITLDREAGTGAVEVVIETRSVDTGSALFNEHIQGSDFLDTAQFPTATYRSTAIKFDGDKPVSVEGQLTLKGVTRPVTLTVTSFKCMPHPMVKKDACGANAVATVKRSEFGAGKYAPHVGDEVNLSIAIEAIRE